MFINPSDFKNYLYCPRQIFYKYVVKIEEIETSKMKAGIIYQEKIQALEKRRVLKKYGIEDNFIKHFNIHIKDEELKISGIVDMAIETSGEIIPVDFKLNLTKITTPIELQLKVYSELLKKKFNKKSTRGFIYFIIEDSIKEIEMEKDEILKLFNETKANIINIITNEKLPEVETEYEKCTECGYKNFCNDFR